MSKKMKSVGKKQILENPLLESKVNQMIDNGETLAKIQKLCKEYDVDISVPTLQRYKQDLKEARETQTPIGELVDGRSKQGNILEIASKREDGSNMSNAEMMNNVISKGNTVFSHLDYLEEIINKSFNTVKAVNALSPEQGMKAIELYTKMTGNSLEGISLMGAKEIRLQYSAYKSAVTGILLNYIPEDKHEEVLKAIEEYENDYYNELGLEKEGQRARQAIGDMFKNVK